MNGRSSSTRPADSAARRSFIVRLAAVVHRRHCRTLSIRGRLGRDHQSMRRCERSGDGGPESALKLQPGSCASARSTHCRPTACRARLPSSPIWSTPGHTPRTSESAWSFWRAPTKPASQPWSALHGQVPPPGLLRRIQRRRPAIRVSLPQERVRDRRRASCSAPAAAGSIRCR